MSNSLEPDQDRQNVGPDLDPNCLQKSSADLTSSKELNMFNLFSLHENVCVCLCVHAFI